MRRFLVRVLAVTLLGVAAGPAALVVPAHAAACAGGQGVTVVVGSRIACDSDGGGRAASNFADAGHQLTYASRAPGFVCRVDGAPASDPCLEASPADAYWALFWSDGTSGTWIYSSVGVTSLKVPRGGSVAFVFQDSQSRTWPPVAPTVAAPEPTRATTAPPAAGSNGSGTARKERSKRAQPRQSVATTGPSGAPAAPTASMSPTTPPTSSIPTPTASSPTASVPTDAVESQDAVVGAPAIGPTAEASGPSSTSTGAVVTGLAVVAVLAGAGGYVWFRRRTG